MEQIKNRIREGMKARGINASKLSKMSGVAEASISNYLNGKVKPKADNISKIASALEVNEAWLMGYDVAPDAEKNTVFSNDGIAPVKAEYKEKIARLYKSIIMNILSDDIDEDDLVNINDYIVFIRSKK